MANKIKELLESRNISTYRVSKDTGIPQSTLSYWKSGQTEPNSKNLVILAQYFGVSTDYLLGGDDNETKETN